LLDGDSLPKSIEEGEALLRKAAASGFAAAMLALGGRLIDGTVIKQDAEEGKAWLIRAIRAGDADAMRELGERLLDGRGLPRSGPEGERWLRRAAERGDLEAMEELGTRLIEGVGLLVNQLEGELWLKRASRHEPRLLTNLGVKLFQRGQVNAAVDAFLKAFEAGSAEAGNDIAYMLRRGEVPSERVPQPIDYYLAKGLAEDSPFNRINLALCLAQGFQHEQDWLRGDDLVRGLGEAAAQLVDWWYPLAKNADAEGDLVLGWLSHHGLIVDPDGTPSKQRLGRARDAGWAVPEWLLIEAARDHEAPEPA
jgi:TPR repeat protein